MQIILLEKVANLGGLGDVVKVRDGFARNYLIPQGKAKRATKENLASSSSAARSSRKAQASSSRQAQEQGARSSRPDGADHAEGGRRRASSSARSPTPTSRRR